jgi:hypothetical protein
VSRILTAFFSLTFATASMASPALIWDNGTNTVDWGGYCSPCSDALPYRAYDDFILSANATITGISAEIHAYRLQDISISIWDFPSGAVLFEKTFTPVEYAAVPNGPYATSGNITISVSGLDVSLAAGAARRKSRT